MVNDKSRRQSWGDNPTNAVILEVAINGSWPKALNPNIPRTVEEITAEALRVLDAGASIVHNHNNEPIMGGTGRNASEPYIAAWAPVLERYPDVILHPTIAGGGANTNIETRTAHLRELAEAGYLSMGIMDMGTCNVAPLDARGVPTPGDALFINTFADIEYALKLYAEFGAGPSLGVHEIGEARAVAKYWEAGLIPKGAMVRTIFAGPGFSVCPPPTITCLDAYLESIEPTGLPWNVSCTAGDVLDTPVARAALERGGHLRVGLEDSLNPTATNVQLVERAIKLAKEVGRPIADPATARKILGINAGTTPRRR